MKHCLMKRSFLFLFFWLMLNNSLIMGEEAGENMIANPEAPVVLEEQKLSEVLLAPKSLDRRQDPLVVTGDILSIFHGLKIENFRVFAHNGQELNIIPFQVDERDPEGEFVFTGGEVAGSDDDYGLFDYNDEIVLMAKDMGGQVSRALWGEMGNRAAEIVITDPKDASKKGWAYLIHFSENPPPLSTKDYVSYTPGKEIVRTPYYVMRYIKGAPFYMDLSYTKEAGGSEEDFFDRIKVRLTVKAFFNIINVTKTEEDFMSVVVGYRDGPIRVMRRVENYFRILFNLSSPSIFSVNEYYERLTYTPVQVTIPFNLKYVFNSFGISDWTWRIYGDFPGLKGCRAYTDRNFQGFRFTGNHSQEFYEKNIDKSRFAWGLMVKEGVGAWFPNILLPEILYGVLKLYVVDDEKFLDPPDDTPGLIGGGMEGQWKGMNEDLWFSMEKGTYELSLDTYFPHSSIKVEDVDEWINIRNFPLWVEVEETKGEQLQAATGLPDKDGACAKQAAVKSRNKKKGKDLGHCAILTDTRGRALSLSQMAIYVGSYRVTPRDYIIARLFNKEKYVRPDFKDIKRIDHHLEDVDPISGMKYPMVQRVTNHNGKTVDLLGCKVCGFSGRHPDGRKVFLWETQIQSIEFNECPAEQ